MTRRTTTALCMTALGLALTLPACEDDARPTTPGPPVVNPSPSPSPSPEPTPTPEANRPPTVAVTSGGGCHPVPGRPCTVGFNATASDPDGDSIAYGWDGCAQGNAAFTTCTIAQPGQVTAIVLVSDGQGNFARASAVAHGTNEPPLVRFGARPPDPAPSNTIFSFFARWPEDPEGDEDPGALCDRLTVSATGPCRAGRGRCSRADQSFDWDVTALQGPGTCVVEARVADLWGAVGRDRIAFQVLP